MNSVVDDAWQSSMVDSTVYIRNGVRSMIGGLFLGQKTLPVALSSSSLHILPCRSIKNMMDIKQFAYQSLQ